jgi:hypothetical protein
VINPFRLFFWKKLKPYDVPNWVSNAAHDFEFKYFTTHGHRPYNIITHFNGKTFKYKVYFETLEQGRINMKVFKKLRSFKI